MQNKTPNNEQPYRVILAAGGGPFSPLNLIATGCGSMEEAESVAATMNERAKTIGLATRYKAISRPE
jgi:hypothetical protein